MTRVNNTKLSCRQKKQLVKDVDLFLQFLEVNAGSNRKRNPFNLVLFTDSGISNPTYQVFIFQTALNTALTYLSLETIVVDGFFGGDTARAIQRLLNSYDPSLNIDGKIVTTYDTTTALKNNIEYLVNDVPYFVMELLNLIKMYGHIQQDSRLPLSSAGPYQAL